MAPLGGPVVPDVVDQDGEIAGATARNHLVPQRFAALDVIARPSAMNSASDNVIGSLKALRPSMSKTTIFCKVGQRARHARTLSSCSSSSAKIIWCGSH